MGLTYSIRVATARESENGTTFHLAVEIAQRIKCIHSQGRESMIRDKRPYRSCSFTGISSRGRIQFGRGNHGKTAYSTHHVARGVVARPYFSTTVPSSLNALLVS